jgi:hypothetical protein
MTVRPFQFKSRSADNIEARIDLPKALIVAAAIFGIGGAGVGLFALQSSHPAEAGASEPAVAKSSDRRLVTVQIPARIAELGFAITRPEDFETAELPEQEPQFERPEFLMPLHVSMPPYAAIVFSVAARPAYENGIVEDWARYLAGLQGWRVEGLAPGKVGALSAIVCDAVNPSEAGPMHCRYCFFEDGQRFIVISTMAPEALWADAEGTLQAMIDSFRLDAPRGQTVAVSASAGTTAKTAEPSADDAPALPTDLALADDAASLDQDHPTNARLRDNGVGLVPRVIEVNLAEKYAVLGAGAIVSTFRVPLGWHTIDDGKRTLVFDADGKIQVSLNIRQCGSDHKAFLQGVLRQHLAEQSDIEHVMLELAGMQCLGLRNYRVDGEVLQQAFLVKDVGDQSYAIVARITADDANIVRAMDLAEVLLADLSHGGR